MQLNQIEHLHRQIEARQNRVASVAFRKEMLEKKKVKNYYETEHNRALAGCCGGARTLSHSHAVLGSCVSCHPWSRSRRRVGFVGVRQGSGEGFRSFLPLRSLEGGWRTLS
jgi:hypothetical protein